MAFATDIELPYRARVITGAQIRAARALLDMTQAGLAAATGLSETVIKNVEASRSDPRASTLQRIEDAFLQAGVTFIDNGQDSRDGGRGVRLIRRN